MLKRTLLHILSILLPLQLILLVVFFFYTRNILERESYNQMKVQVERVQEDLEGFLRERDANVFSWSKMIIPSIALEFDRPERAAEWLEQLKRDYPSFADIVLYNGTSLFAVSDQILDDTQDAIQKQLITKEKEPLTDKHYFLMSHALYVIYPIPLYGNRYGYIVGIISEKPFLSLISTINEYFAAENISSGTGFLYDHHIGHSTLREDVPTAFSDSQTLNFPYVWGKFSYICSAIQSPIPVEWSICARAKTSELSQAEVQLLKQFGFLLVLLSVISAVIFSLLVSKRIARPIDRIADEAGRIGSGDLETPIGCDGEDEIGRLASTLDYMRQKIKEQQQIIRKEAAHAALGKIASQVAHDIRSPLTALKVVSGHLAELPEEKRVMIRNAVQRIDDIANDLVERKGVEQSNTSKCVTFEKKAPSIHLLSSLIEPLISEKRTQYRGKLDVHIESTLDASSYGLFAAVQPTEFKRVFSNLINNAVEALGDEGMVTVSLQSEGEKVLISVRDNGPGISAEILPKLMERGATFGKQSGSGLGLAHARTTVEEWGGSVVIESKVGEGTIVIVTLPRAMPPSWFVPKLQVVPGMTVAIIDDDASIHNVWEERFDAIRAEDHQIALHHFTSASELKKWNELDRCSLFLCDYELLGEPKNGLDLIEQFQLQTRSVLVTSRYEESDVRARCARLGIQLIPKGLAGYVPIEVRSASSEKRARNGVGHRVLVIDDDDGVRVAWKFQKKPFGIGELVAHSSMEACETSAPDYTTFDYAFLDKNIPESKWTIKQTITHLKAQGVKRVIVASGENQADLNNDPDLAAADGICHEKIPKSLEVFG